MPLQSESRGADSAAASTPLYFPLLPTEEKYMRSVEQHQLKEMPELTESWIAQNSTVSQDTTIKKVGEQVSDSETPRPEFVRLVAQCSILVVIAGIVAGLIAS
jgi:hypothetical protein